MQRLRIGVNALYLIPGGVGGTEVYLRNLLRALAEMDRDDEFVVFTNRETGPDLVPGQPNFHAAQQPVRATNRPARIAWEQTGLVRSLRREGIDVLLNAGFTSPVFAPCPSVTVFHDLQHKRHPEYFRWFDLPFWQMCLYASAHRSKLLIAISEATKSDLLRYYRLPPEKVRVVPHGVAPEFFEIGSRRRESPPGKYFLCVSTLHPHKNLERLINAFGRFHATHQEFSLIIAGMRGFHTDAVEATIKSLGLESSVELTGWVPGGQLRELYRGAFAFVYPSTFEGFGLPVLEALAAGIPCACSAIEPLKSIADSAALLFDPQDTSALERALEKLACDGELRTALADAGPRRAAQFSWLRSAEQTLEALREVAR